MPTGKRLSDAEVNEIASEVKMGTMTKRAIAERHGIHPTSISKVLQRANGQVKATAKRKTAKKPVKPQAVSIDALLKEYKSTLARAVSIRKQIDDEIEKAVK